VEVKRLESMVDKLYKAYIKKKYNWQLIRLEDNSQVWIMSNGKIAKLR